MQNVMDQAALERFIAEEFREVAGLLSVDEVTEQSVTLRLDPDDAHLRPGGTVSGPTMFLLADVAIYLAILAKIGPVALAVTTNAHIDFMRKPQAGVPLLGEASLLKLGRSLAVGQVMIRNPESDAILAHASMTYSIPPTR
ncbi:PaaI family thioesterase [Celeribacter litoreus]|uniref:PaaI family thioesterase n=1 Tax=Celeribacter litoreus TaxID=2876714 RepID=UPI001CCE2E1C|nr:PaaI family thioesterase [Celeribacter litoreus]MCA0043894.1 PaaI family thioesterase [Celeribacter litoreus]